MYNVNVTTAGYTLLHNGKSLANIYCTVGLTLAASDSPNTANTANWPANVPLYLPMADTLTYAKASTTNGTVHVVRPLQ